MSTRPTTRARAAGLLTAITMTAVLAACSANDDSADGGANDAGSGMDSGSGSERSFGSAEAPTKARGSGDQSAADSATGSERSATPEMQRAIIASGTVSLTSDDVAETRREVQRVVDAQSGEITEESTETDEDGETSYARLVIRVPSSKFGDAMEALEKAGRLRASDRGSEDVTTQVIDTDVRVRAQEASLKRVELLLAEAKTLKEIIWIESQLTSRQAELDSLKSQQSWLKDQTSLSTITVDISTAPGTVEEEDHDRPAGFLAGLRGGTKALGGMVVALATVLGALLPFAVLALVLGLPVWLLVRRRKAPAAPAEPVQDV